MNIPFLSKKNIGSIFLVFFLSTSRSFGITINVPGDQSTIAAAVSAANSGDVIVIAPGTYVEPSAILINKQLTITSQWRTAGEQVIAQTVLDGVNKSHTLFETVDNFGVNVEISGLTFTRFNKPIVINDSAVIQKNVFTNNGFDSISFEFTGFGYAGFNTIANSSDDGIDVDAKEGAFTIEFNTIRNNGDDGIEIRLFTGSQPNMTYDIHDNILSGNNEDGLQLIDHASDDSGRVFDIYNNVFDSNAMVGLGCMPGGNTTENFGGANIVERVNFHNNTVINNAVGVTGGDNFIALNNIIANNTNEGVKRLRVNSVLAHSIFYNNGMHISDAITDAGILLNVDPQYDPVTYQLLAGSPSIDNGVATFTWNGALVLTLDSSKFVGPAPDLGAKEFGSGGGGGNTAPTVNAGSDQIIFHPTDSLNLLGQASDDGLPNPPAAIMTTWNQESGPGTVTFANLNDPMTTAFFPLQGKYQLRITGDDSDKTASDSVVVRYANGGSGNTVAIQTPGTTFFEAEDYAYLYGAAQKINDIAASGNLAIEVPEGSGTVAFSEHTLSVTDQNITFYVWIRGKGFDQNSDAVFVSFVDSPEREVILSSDNTYGWFQVPGSFTAPAGSWPLIIRAGEDGVIWDQAAFSTDPSFVPGGNQINTLEVRISASADDAEESAAGKVALTSGDLELIFDGSNQTVGMRFNGVGIPKNAAISNAYLQFKADELQSEVTALTIQGQNNDNAAAFTTATRNISTRAKTAAIVSWTPAPWTTVGQMGLDQQTANIAPIIQEIVRRSGWLAGNSLAIIISGTGHRTAEAFNGDKAGAPLLHVEYSTGTPTNQAPNVNAGLDQSITLPNSTALDGTVTDDSLPNPPGAVMTTWSQVQVPPVPGTVTFGNPNAAVTTASFSAAGTYVLRLTADDGALTASDDVTITVNTQGTQPTILEKRVAASADDAEESATGSVSLTSSDLELVNDGSNQTVGMRFNNVTIPPKATIQKAYIQFQTDETGSTATNLTIQGQDAGDALAFTTTSTNISSRPKTGASVPWSPVPWLTIDVATADQRTPEIKTVIQEIVDRSDWASGHSLAVIITGTGKRTAEAYNGVPAAAPLLHVEYTQSSP